MKDNKNNQKEFNTCLEDSSFAEMLQKKMEQQGTGSLISRFPDEQVTLLIDKRSKNRKDIIIENIMKLHQCVDCPVRRRATEKPHSIFARIHRWHRTWWPGWKIYQAGSHVRNCKTMANIIKTIEE